MAQVDASGRPADRRWGDHRALLDDDEARRRLLDAASRCIVRRGDAEFRMAEVADEAGVAGMGHPRDFFKNVEEFSLADQRRIMRDNARELTFDER